MVQYSYCSLRTIYYRYSCFLPLVVGSSPSMGSRREMELQPLAREGGFGRFYSDSLWGSFLKVLSEGCIRRDCGLWGMFLNVLSEARRRRGGNFKTAMRIIVLSEDHILPHCPNYSRTSPPKMNICTFTVLSRKGQSHFRSRYQRQWVRLRGYCGACWWPNTDPFWWNRHEEDQSVVDLNGMSSLQLTCFKTITG